MTAEINPSAIEKISRSRAVAYGRGRDGAISADAQRFWVHWNDWRKEEEHDDIAKEDNDPGPDRHFHGLEVDSGLFTVFLSKSVRPSSSSLPSVLSSLWVISEYVQSRVMEVFI